ncbi:MAG: ABC transporter substrate-binding protein [Candidatus Cloacimonetes bacterium]|nr:ABC transporter substrate-binding protein [Candidatus Cloacimonadota bacterium]
MKIQIHICHPESRVFARERIQSFISLLFLLTFFSCNPSPPKTKTPRYIVTSPEVAEIISLIQGTKNIVGITAECTFPVELKTKKVVGTFGKVDYEKIISLQPTHVFTSALEQDAIASELDKLNIKTVQIYPKSISELISSIREIGKNLDEIDRANFVADSLQIRIDQLVVSNSSTYHSSVYIEIYGNPLMSVSDDSFVGELLTASGGKNVFSKLPRDYSRIKPEKVIEANPEIIILTYPGISAEDIQNRKGWEVISACQTGKIYSIKDIDPDLILRASPRVIEGISKLQELLSK